MCPVLVVAPAVGRGEGVLHRGLEARTLRAHRAVAWRGRPELGRSGRLGRPQQVAAAAAAAAVASEVVRPWLGERVAFGSPAASLGRCFGPGSSSACLRPRGTNELVEC